MSKHNPDKTSRPVCLKAVIICNDTVFAAEAVALLRKVGAHGDLMVAWDIKCWPLNALSDSALGTNALSDSLDAHLIVLPATRARLVPPRVSKWLRTWAEQRLVPDAALGFLRERGDSRSLQTLSSELKAIVQQHGVKMVIGEDYFRKGVLESVKSQQESRQEDQWAPVNRSYG
jgi:hypothetical protein